MTALSLFDAAAERAALVSGRPKSQEMLRAKGVDVAPSGPLLEVHGFRRDRTFCGLEGGSATTHLRAVTCAKCREAAR